MQSAPDMTRPPAFSSLQGSDPLSRILNSAQIELFAFSVSHAGHHRPFVSQLWIKARGVKLSEDPHGGGGGGTSWAAGGGGLPSTHIFVIRSQSELSVMEMRV